MSLYQYKGKSMPQRIVLTIIQTVILATSGWILFGGEETLNSWWGWTLGPGNGSRQLMLLILYMIVYIRMMFTIYYLLKRSIHWEEAFSIPFAFGLYYIGFSLFSLTTAEAITIWDGMIVLLFLAGSWVNTFSEWKRDQWKKRPENKGKVYDEGLFKYSTHINYFGDVLWVTALALLTRNPWALLIPLLLICLFVFYNIPMLDRHLEEKYGKDFVEYQKKSKKLVPFIY
ncbi:DUF1295 domain-containing protein [Alkalihalobacillus sp. AL-G]|uniref:DUF1295 domain-containing protein n=1 Tax=Alkalihalobacillus sp. AL-G TaxID=2926399 RepID=UPI00272A0D26|nr:DUF1295 domain-containing protein [Alkalihalobacillus sp. AL-G]WLD92569.1 DUF1295 domain-containing protein [Alkalihalobacillus sp. AL-G]